MAEAAAQLRLDCPSTAVDALLLWLGSRTGYGTVARNSAPRDGRLDELLSGLAVGFLRRTRVTATTLLRNRLYLGFGLPGTHGLPELPPASPTPRWLRLLRERRRQTPRSAGAVAMRRPRPVSAGDPHYLWALAEAVTDWRLYLSIGGPEVPLTTLQRSDRPPYRVDPSASGVRSLNGAGFCA